MISGRGKGGPSNSKVGEVFSYDLGTSYINFQQKIPSEMSQYQSLRHSPAYVRWNYLLKIGIASAKGIRKNTPSYRDHEVIEESSKDIFPQL